MTLLVSFARKADYKNDEQKKTWCKKPVPAICLPFLYTKSFIRAH